MTWRSKWWLFVLVAASNAGAQDFTSFSASVRELLAHDSVRVGRAAERAAVERIYRQRDTRPLWAVVGDGPTRQAIAIIDALASAATRGLDSTSYDVATVRMLADSASRSPSEAARFDVTLTRVVTKFILDLHTGRIDPTAVRLGLPDAHDRFDVASVVPLIAEAADVPAAVTRVEPPYAGYHALARALARYRALAVDTTVRAPRRPGKTIRPGDAYADAPALARFLAALGDLDPENTARREGAESRYDGTLVDAVVRFQRRHGLTPDSAIGPATMSQLRIPLSRRVRQIELTLERWRWLPDSAPERYVIVNIPAFELYAFEDDPLGTDPGLIMNVIVGQAEGRHDTPVFIATMTEVVFRPYWDVPVRIARTELIPTFQRTPAYFESDGFEIVRRTARDVSVPTYPPTAENFSRVVNNELRLRQRPGPTNALGQVKFVFPNRYDVYLHGTPAQELFVRTRRDFSHGCIRTERPSDLAALVLQDQAPWTRAAIDSAMAGDKTVHVPIARPFAVYVLYATAVVDFDGVVNFYPDLYRHDATLERALGLTSGKT